MARSFEEAAYLVTFDCHVESCEHIHVALHDVRGDPYAVATLTPDQARNLIKYLQDALYKKSVEKDECRKQN